MQASIEANFKDNGFLLLPHFLAADEADRFAKATSLLPLTRTNLGGDGSSWSERDLTPGSQLWKAIISPDLLQQVRFLVGDFSSCYGWLNLYKVDEQIAWHKDIVGVMQFLCVLQAPPVDEGQLQLHVGEEIRTVPARAGDAILFKAHETLHRTTPIRSPHHQRITVAMRFLS